MESFPAHSAPKQDQSRMPRETDAQSVDDCALAERTKVVSHRSEVVARKLPDLGLRKHSFRWVAEALLTSLRG